MTNDKIIKMLFWIFIFLNSSIIEFFLFSSSFDLINDIILSLENLVKFNKKSINIIKNKLIKILIHPYLK